jgi:SAM-dependent methyltransferase
MNVERTWQQWEERHQPFEFTYHYNEGVKWCANEEQMWSFWWKIFDFATFSGRVMGKTLDIGCGPRPPLQVFREGDNLTIIEPLADKYQKITPPEWWKGITVFSQPAEEFIDDLQGTFDTILCWNCIDHTVGFDTILQNIFRYAKDDALIVLATDFHPPGIGHPGFTFDEFMYQLNTYFTIEKEEKNFQERDYAWILKKKL